MSDDTNKPLENLITHWTIGQKNYERARRCINQLGGLGLRHISDRHYDKSSTTEITIGYTDPSTLLSLGYMVACPEALLPISEAGLMIGGD